MKHEIITERKPTASEPDYDHLYHYCDLDMALCGADLTVIDRRCPEFGCGHLACPLCALSAEAGCRCGAYGWRSAPDPSWRVEE